MIQWESPHELKAYRILDANPAVSQFTEQPLEIRYRMNGTVYRHYPDTLVLLERSKELWEIKPAEGALDSETVARTALLTQALPYYGYQYRMVTGEGLSREPRQSNVVTILHFGRKEITLVEREYIRRAFTKNQTITWGDAVDGAFGKMGRHHICRLILEGELIFDIEQPLSNSTVLRSAHEVCRSQVGSI